MSEEDEFDRRTRRLDARGRSRLLDDLEAIRSLLGDDAADVPAAEAIPVLREVVEPTTQGAPGAAPAAAPPMEPSRQRQEDQGDLIDVRAFADRLLDDDWAEERERILADVRTGVNAFSLGLDEASRREREARLREAVAMRLAPRMEQIVGEALDRLRDALAREMTRELDGLMSDVFGPADGHHD
ncbi:MAG: hypothetical protein V2J24_23365 [Pseudomonadales bacterium]|jgi:hypothetical protein|nr:hypothetical protein [Pseudomonadales bacterium]